MKRAIEFRLNGQAVHVEARGGQTLLELLRQELGLNGVKEGCGAGECGACTVIVDGQALTSCIFPALEVEGASVTTIEGLAAPDGTLHPVQEAFVRNGAVQCGFCTPGQILSAKALLDLNPHPSEEQIRTALEGNLCRCTGYQQIIEAVKAAAEDQP
ncbi:MAG: (2Fe-2S)-binding protein [Desulfarculus sp.]|nr:(2Fe-2S)-binding protein [Desulfarculus sp.]